MALNMGCFPVEKPAKLVDELRWAAVGSWEVTPFYTAGDVPATTGG